MKLLTLIAGLAFAASMFGCEVHQRVEFGDALVEKERPGVDQPLRLTTPMTFRLTRGEQVVAYTIIPYSPETPDRPVAQVALNNSAPVVTVDQGAVVAAGMRPVVKSTRIVAGASGTEFIFIETRDTPYVLVTKSSAKGVKAVTVTARDGRSIGVDPMEFAFLDATGSLQVRPLKFPVTATDINTPGKLQELVGTLLELR